MSSWLDWLNAETTALENALANAWNSLVLAERQHPVILALATLIVFCFLLSLLCNCCCWLCGLWRPRQRAPGLIFVPANYGTMVYPPPMGGKPPAQPAPGQPQPSTSKQVEAMVHV